VRDSEVLTQVSQIGTKAYSPVAARYSAPYFAAGLSFGRNSSMKNPAIAKGAVHIMTNALFL